MNRTVTPQRCSYRNILLRTLLLVCLHVFYSGASAQQVIGSFPYMNGGFEGQTAGALANSAVHATNWTRQSQTGASTTLTNSSSAARSGNNYIAIVNVATASRAAQAPQSTTATDGPTASTAYQLQFFVKNAAAVNGFQGGVTTNGTTNPTYSTAATLAINTSWTKQTFTLTTAAAAVTGAGIAVVRSTAGTYDVDDIVIYAGSSADNTAPDVAGSPATGSATTSSLNVSWSAPGTGVDGGGYVVVRYSTSPDPTDDPNQNGIYAVSNTFTVVNQGTVVYIGTGTSFTDAGLTSATTYYYKIYTVDKAFNYSAEASANGTTTGSAATIGLSSPAQVTAANQNQGATSVVLSKFEAAVSGSSATLNGIDFTTGGTYTASDLYNFKLWYNTTNTISGATQLGSSITTIPATGNTLSFSGLSQNIAAASTGYFFLTCDISVSATPASTVSIAANPTLTFASGSISGTITAGGDQTFVAVTPDVAIGNVHPAAGSITQGSSNSVLAGFQFAVTTANTTLNSITVTTGGTYQTSDIQTNGFKIWVNTTNTMVGATQIGSGLAAVASGATLSFTSLAQTFTAGSTHYVFVTVDMASTAVGGHTIQIDATPFSNIVFASGTQSGTNPVAAAGVQTIPTPAIALADQHSAAGLIYGNTNKVVLAGFNLAVTTANTQLTSLTVTTAGTYQLTEVSATPFRLWYNTSNSIVGAVQLGTAQAAVASGNTVSFTGLTQSIAAGATGYVFVTVDIASPVTAGNTIGLGTTAFSNFTFNAGVLSGTDPVAASNMQTMAVFAFAPGSLVGSRVGDGATALTSAALPVDLVQYSQSGTVSGSVSLPSGATGTRLTNSGSATSEGHLTLSADGKQLTVVGYDAQSGSTNVAASTSSRVVAFVDSSATVDMSTIIPGAYSGTNIRGAVRDGNNVWTGGPTAGVLYTTAGTNGNGTSVLSTGSQRFPAIFGYADSTGVHKQLYSAIAATLSSIGTGLPTSAATSTALTTTAGAGYLQYVMFDANPSVAGLDLLYVSNKNGAAAVAGVLKFYFDGTTWIAAGSYTGESVCGLTGNRDAAGVVHLFITSGTSTSGQPTNIYGIDDNTGSTGSISGSFTSGTLLATSGSNYSIRGLAWAPTAIINQPTSTTVCVGNAANFTLTMKAGAGAQYEYFWQRSLDGGNTWSTVTALLDGGVYTSNTSTPTLQVATNGTLNGAKFRCFVRYMSQYWLESDVVTLTVNEAPVVTMLSVDTTVCGSTNNTVQFEVTATGATPTYQWEVSGNNGNTWAPLSNDAVYSNVTSAILTITNATSILNGNQFHCIATGVCAPADTSTSVVLTITNAIANNTISGTQTICANTASSVLTGSTPTGGSGVYQYQWLESTTDSVSGYAVASGINNAIDYNAGTRSQQTWFKRVVVSGACSADTSSFVAIQIAPPVANNTISGAQTICSGSTPAQITGSVPTGGDGSPYTYQWLVSSVSDSTGFGTAFLGTGQNYSPSSLTSSRWYKRVVSSGVCAKDTSSVVQVKVTQPISNNSVPGSGQPICAGSVPPAFIGSTPSGGDGTTFEYEWMWSTNFSTGYTVIPSSNSKNYAPGALTQTTYYKRIVSSGACAKDTSDFTYVAVSQPISDNSITGSPQTICYATAPAQITGSTPTGGDGANYTYTWLKSTTSATEGFTVLSFSNTVNYTPSALTQTSWFRRVVSSGVCDKDTTSAIEITVTPLITNNSITGSTQTICPGSTPAQITASVPTGGDGSTYMYEWLSSTTSATTGFSSIPSSNSQDFTPSALTTTTWFKRSVTSGGCTHTTSAIQITVNAPGVWTGAVNSDWNNTANWSCPLVPTSTTNVTIPGSGVTNALVVSDAQQVANLTIQSGATLTLNAITSQLSIYGSITNSGTFSNTNGKIILAGSALQTLPAGTYTKLEIMNTSNVNLGGAVSLTDSLILTNGKLNLGDNNLTLGNNSYASLGSATSYVAITGLGELTIQNVGSTGKSGAVVFPMGAGSFNPVSLINLGTTDAYSISVKDSVVDYASGTLSSDAVDRTWLIEEAVVGGSNVSLTFQWAGTDELSGFVRSSSYVSRGDVFTWLGNTASAASGSNPYTQTITGITSFSYYQFAIGSGTVLPVQLLSFTATKQKEVVALNWVTASEINNSHFNLQRSIDGVVFEDIATVKGQGTTSKVSNYNYVDAKAASLGVSVVYYRLVQVDFNSRSTTSKVVAVQVGGVSAGLTATVSPNPFVSNAALTIQSAQANIATLTIVDAKGMVVEQRNIELKEGATLVELNQLHGSGLYWIHLVSGSEQLSLKVVKTN